MLFSTKLFAVCNRHLSLIFSLTYFPLIFRAVRHASTHKEPFVFVIPYCIVISLMIKLIIRAAEIND